MRRKKIADLNPFVEDAAIILISVLLAVLLYKTHTLHGLLAVTQGFLFIESLVAGVLFTSVFTTPLAIVALAEISHDFGIFYTALWGALGAVLGDMLIYWFVKDRLSEHIMALLSHQGMGRRVRALFRRRLFRRLSFFVGALIIASPLPDELGIMLMGFSKARIRYFVLLTLVFNFLGILFIGYLAS